MSFDCGLFHWFVQVGKDEDGKLDIRTRAGFGDFALYLGDITFDIDKNLFWEESNGYNRTRIERANEEVTTCKKYTRHRIELGDRLLWGKNSIHSIQINGILENK